MDFIYCLLYQMDSRFFSSNLYIHVYFGSLVSVEWGRFHHCRILGNNHIHTVRSTFRKVFRLPKGICATMRACNYSYEHWDIHVLFLNKITEFGNKTKINFLLGWTDANICESISLSFSTQKWSYQLYLLYTNIQNCEISGMRAHSILNKRVM